MTAFLSRPAYEIARFHRARTLLRGLTRWFYRMPVVDRWEFLARCVERVADDHPQGFDPHDFLFRVVNDPDSVESWLETHIADLSDLDQPTEGATRARMVLQVYVRLLVDGVTGEQPDENRIDTFFTLCVTSIRNCPISDEDSGSRQLDAALDLIEFLGLEAPENDHPEGHLFRRVFYNPFPDRHPKPDDAFQIIVTPRLRNALANAPEALAAAVRAFRVDVLGVFHTLPELQTPAIDRALIAPLGELKDYEQFFQAVAEVIARCQVPKPLMRIARKLPRLPLPEGETFLRASGEGMCSCGFRYADHPTIGEDDVLRQLCDGSTVKL